MVTRSNNASGPTPVVISDDKTFESVLLRIIVSALTGGKHRTTDPDSLNTLNLGTSNAGTAVKSNP